MKYKLSILLIILVLVSCKTTKMIGKQEGTKSTNPAVQVIEKVQKSQPEFKTANVSKMSLELNMGDRKVNVSASCKIRKDSAMFVSFQVFGFEVFKSELMPDSMKVFDKMNRRFYVVDYSFFSKRFGVNVDYNSLQSLFSAKLFCVGKKQVQADSCKLEALSNGENKLTYESGNLVQSTQLSAANLIQQVILKAKNSDYQLQTTYSDYTNTSGINFPQNIAIVANGQKAKVNCTFSILSVEFNTDLKFAATSTDRYTRGELDQLLKK